jgi:hypothetical protein
MEIFEYKKDSVYLLSLLVRLLVAFHSDTAHEIEGTGMTITIYDKNILSVVMILGVLATWRPLFLHVCEYVQRESTFVALPQGSMCGCDLTRFHVMASRFGCR